LREWFKYFGFLGLIVSLQSCYYDNEELLYGNDDCVVEGVSFANDIRPIINTTCAVSGCHVQGGSGNGVYDNYDNVKAKVDNGSLQQRILIDQDHPPNTTLSNCQLLFIEEWIKTGALNN
jgi:hypothetical protein